MLKNTLKLSTLLIISTSLFSCVNVEYDEEMGFSEKLCVKKPGQICECPEGFVLRGGKK
ncbi:MAG: hypothetical protein MK132_11590 [Lentisphaerales bacterium]|nr:hypothetical protein [Lentisphaerales bacterium]